MNVWSPTFTIQPVVEIISLGGSIICLTFLILGYIVERMKNENVKRQTTVRNNVPTYSSKTSTTTKERRF